MKEFKTDKAIIRIHGEPNLERVKAATERFLKKAEQQRREKNT